MVLTANRTSRVRRNIAGQYRRKSPSWYDAGEMYTLIKCDGSDRLGRVTTQHGTFDTPAFMPVGTQGTIKGVLPDHVAATGAQIVLANTYHLMLRPSADVVAELGDLHKFMSWPGPILTDSGGFQVFSLADLNKIDETC